MSDDLKPCPFCGQPPYARHARANPWAGCKTEGCWGAKLPIVSLDSPKDVEAWNTRAADAQLAAAEARAERLANALDWIGRKLFMRSWGGTLGAPSDWRIAGDYRHTTQRMKGPTLLDAVESAALAEGEAG